LWLKVLLFNFLLWFKVLPFQFRRFWQYWQSWQFPIDTAIHSGSR
jgi:hypothetical protein